MIGDRALEVRALHTGGNRRSARILRRYVRKRIAASTCRVRNGASRWSGGAARPPLAAGCSGRPRSRTARRCAGSPPGRTLPTSRRSVLASASTSSGGTSQPVSPGTHGLLRAARVGGDHRPAGGLRLDGRDPELLDARHDDRAAGGVQVLAARRRPRGPGTRAERWKRRRSRGSSGPSPTTRIRRPASSAASSATSTRLCRVISPTNSRSSPPGGRDEAQRRPPAGARSVRRAPSSAGSAPA